jgi:glycosyltransferase involved in cell wall biosynthesis
MTAMLNFRPAYINVVDLKVKGRTGSPLTPLMISRALSEVKATQGVFWNPGFVPPLYTRVPSVITVHDLTHLEFYGRRHKYYYNYVFRPLYHQCDAIVCVSEYTRKKFIEWSGITASKVHVVLNGGATRAYFENKETLNLPFRYVLYAGNHRPYKNLDRLITAFFGSSLPRQEIHLVITGAENSRLRMLSRQFGNDRYVHFLGNVRNDDLPKLYKGSLAVAFVSLSEGFGLPIVEGMASGVPILTSTVTSMPEVAGDAALLVNPFSTEEIAKGLDRIVSDNVLRSELIEQGSKQVKTFDWRRSARELWDIIDYVANSP